MEVVGYFRCFRCEGHVNALVKKDNYNGLPFLWVNDDVEFVSGITPRGSECYDHGRDHESTHLGRIKQRKSKAILSDVPLIVHFWGLVKS